MKVHEVLYDNKDGNLTLKLDNINTELLPYVSVLTITKNRRKMFPMAIYCWSKFIYPKNKIEWIILDDGDEDLTELLQELKDDRIKYKKCLPTDVGSKRNQTVSLANYDILVIMDDDDFYFPDSILAKVRILKQYKKKCVYSHTLGV